MENHVVLHEETVRQLKTRIRGSKSYTLVHTLTYTSDMELVPDMCPEKKRSIYDGYNVADALGFVTLESYSKVWQANLQMKRDIYGARMVTLKDVGDQDAGTAPDKNEVHPMFLSPVAPGAPPRGHPLLQCGWCFGLDSWRGAVGTGLLDQRESPTLVSV